MIFRIMKLLSYMCLILNRLIWIIRNWSRELLSGMKNINSWEMLWDFILEIKKIFGLAFRSWKCRKFSREKMKIRKKIFRLLDGILLKLIDLMDQSELDFIMWSCMNLLLKSHLMILDSAKFCLLRQMFILMNINTLMKISNLKHRRLKKKS